jgi:hypothetical protein
MADDSTKHILGVMYIISRSWMDVLNFYVLLFGVAYLVWWDFAMDPTKKQHQILCRSWKKWDGDPGNDWTSVRGRQHEAYRESSNSLRQRKARQVKSMLLFSLTSRELFINK